MDLRRGAVRENVAESLVEWPKGQAFERGQKDEGLGLQEGRGGTRGTFPARRKELGHGSPPRMFGLRVLKSQEKQR